ncbi:hypothetical protein ACFX14_022819 [Malus domestica]
MALASCSQPCLATNCPRSITMAPYHVDLAPRLIVVPILPHNRADQVHNNPNFISNDGAKYDALLVALASKRLGFEKACNPFKFSYDYQLSFKRAHNKTSMMAQYLEKVWEQLTMIPTYTLTRVPQVIQSLKQIAEQYITG